MTEYDFSPEAYERYLATQTRIANWVEKTEQHRSQFEPAIQPSPSPSSLPPARAGLSSHDSHRRLRKRSPPPALPQQAYPQQQQQRYQQPRHLFIHPPSPASESDDDDNDDDAYGHGPGPIPLTGPAVVYSQQQQHRQMAPAYSYPQAMPVMPHPQVVVPPTYMTAPHHKSSSHHRHRSSHTSSRSHNSHGYYNVASPPVSPGYQYAYPHMVAGHPGYMMMQPQPPRPMQYMSSDLPPPPRSAPANVTSFSLPTSPGEIPRVSSTSGNINGSYFQANPNAISGPSSASHPHHAPAGREWSYGVSPQSHSIPSGSTTRARPGPISVGMTTPSVLPHPHQSRSQQAHYFTSIPQYQGLQPAMASPTYPNPTAPAPGTSGPSYSNPLRATQTQGQSNFHYPAMYDSNPNRNGNSGSKLMHFLRRSVG